MKNMKYIIVVLLMLCSNCYAEGVEIRDFNPDTPGKAYSPYTVSQGYYQIESDSFHITEQDEINIIEFFDPVFKYGLTKNIDVELQTNGFYDITSKQNGKTTHIFGYGDVVPSFKWTFIGDDSQDFTAAFKFGVKIPTASLKIGNGAVEYYAILPTQIGLPRGFTLQLQEEIDLLKNQLNTSKHFSYSEDASLSKQFGKIAVSAEMFAQSGTDPHNQAYYTADLGLSYAITPVIAVTAGAYLGLNRYAPKIEAFTGFAFRF